jgi:hypothetical protein
MTVVVLEQGKLEVNVVSVTQEEAELDWGYLNGQPLQEETLRWLGWLLCPDILEELHAQSAA